MNAKDAFEYSQLRFNSLYGKLLEQAVQLQLETIAEAVQAGRVTCALISLDEPVRTAFVERLHDKGCQTYTVRHSDEGAPQWVVSWKQEKRSPYNASPFGLFGV